SAAEARHPRRQGQHPLHAATDDDRSAAAGSASAGQTAEARRAEEVASLLAVRAQTRRAARYEDRRCFTIEPDRAQLPAPHATRVDAQHSIAVVVVQR